MVENKLISEIKKKPGSKKNDPVNEEVKNFKIQLGAFTSIENANRFIDQINNQSFNNSKLAVVNDKKMNFYRVHSKKSYSKENAKKLCEKFIINSYNCILFKI